LSIVRGTQFVSRDGAAKATFAKYGVYYREDMEAFFSSVF
jgi:hypothetical protein